MENIEITDWCLWDWYKSTDFDLVSGDALPDLYQQDDIIYEYNQWNQTWSRNSCTLFSAAGAVSDLFNKEFTLDELYELNELSYTKGRKRDKWRYVSSAVDLVRNWWNNNKERVKKYGKVASYRVEMMDDKVVEDVIKRWYTLCTWYDGSNEYNVDYMLDWILEKDSFWEITYSHAVSVRWRNWKKYIKDNYKGRKYNNLDRNMYQVQPKFSKLVENDVYFYNWYVFTKVAEDNYNELIRLEKMKNLLNTAIASHSELRHLTNDKTYRDFLHEINEKHRKKMSDVEIETNKHS